MTQEPIEVVREVAARFGVPSSRVMGPERHAVIIAARQECVKQIFTRCRHMTQRDVAEFMGGGDNWVNVIVRDIPKDRSGRFLDRPEPEWSSPRMLIRAMAAKQGFTEEQVLGLGRRAALALTRAEIGRELRRQYQLSSVQIGALMHRHHSTVLHWLGRTDWARQNGIPRID